MGMTLLEVTVSLSIIAMATIGLNTIASRYSDDTKVAIAASQTRTFGEAAKAYIKDNYAAVQAVATPTVPALIDVPTLITSGHLAAGFLPTNAYGQGVCALVLEPTANRLQAMVLAEGGTSIDDLSLGSLTAIVGGSGGATYSSDASVIRGAVGGWSIPAATFDNLVNHVNRRCDGTAGNVRVAAGTPAMALWFENGDTSSAFLARDTVPGRPELNAMNTPIVMNSVHVANDACTILGAIARSSTGSVLSCQSGFWKTQGSSYWEDPVANFAALPTCNAAVTWQTRIVQTPTVGTGPRAYTCNGTAWSPLAVNDNGDIVIAGIATAGKVALSDTVTVGSACSPNGLMSKDAQGKILSCQSGVFKAVGPTFSSTPIYGYTPSNQYISGCYASPGYVTVTTPGFYGINMDANGYRYWGSYVSLYVYLTTPAGASTCFAQDNLPAGGGTGYFTPNAYCVEHLDAGTHAINVGGSDASACGTSNLYMLFGGSAKLRLLIPD